MSDSKKGLLVADLSIIVEELSKKEKDWKKIKTLCLKHELPFVKDDAKIIEVLFAEMQTARFKKVFSKNTSFQRRMGPKGEASI